MKRPFDSVVLSLANLSLVGVVKFLSATRIGCCSLGSPANVLAVLILPAVLLWTLVRSLKDLIAPAALDVRLQAFFAIVLSTPAGILTYHVATMRL